MGIRRTITALDPDGGRFMIFSLPPGRVPSDPSPTVTPSSPAPVPESPVRPGMSEQEAMLALLHSLNGLPKPMAPDQAEPEDEDP